MASRNPARPLSPHLQVYKWGPHMLVSILHRATGSGMATVGSLLLVWWLIAIATGEQAYATFVGVFTRDTGALNILGYVFGIGLTWSLLQHMATGIRHLVMDTGAGFELRRNRLGARATLVASTVLTVVFWLYMGIK